MRIVITGATGQVGRRFAPRLLQHLACSGGRGDEVRVLVRDRGRAEALEQAGAVPVEGDLRDGAALRSALAGADAVVNLAAAFRGVPDEEAYAVNRDSALALAEAAVEEGVGRLVHVSTNLVYGAGRGRPAVEDDVPRPGEMWGAYAESKAEAERGLLALHRERGLGLRVARLAFVYGDGDPHLRQSLRWAAGWAAHKRLQMVHHADVAQALLRLLYAPGVDGQVYNVSDDAPVTAFDIHGLTGTPVPEGMDGRADTDPWEGIVSTTRIREELGFRPLYPSVWTARDAGAL